MEIGAALHMSQATARARVERALHLVEYIPATLAALRAGQVDSWRTHILVETTADLPDALRAAVERLVLPAGGSRTPSQLRAQVVRTIARLDPNGAADRAERARGRRDVRCRAESDDLALVTANLGAEKAATMMWVLNTMADAARGPSDPRDTGQRRADALADIFDTLAATGAIDISGCVASNGADATTESGTPENARAGGWRAPRVCLTVCVAASTLEGLDDLPAELAGHGVITPDLARAIAKSATTVRAILVRPGRYGPPGDRDLRVGDPETGLVDLGGPCGHPGCSGDRTCGTVLDFGREVYRPPAVTDDHVRIRDRRCRFPGCRMSAARCDLDHVIPFGNGGSTCPCNMRPLCRSHHLAKTFTGWTPRTGPTDTITWISPLGQSYQDHPDHPIAGQVVAEGVGPPF
jgi:hypothetical protein